MRHDPATAIPPIPEHSRCGQVQPAWRSVATAGELLDLPDRVVLHAGPPFTDPTRPSPVVLSSTVMAILHAGWATEEAQAERMVNERRVRLEPAQHWGGVLPLAAVATRETPVVEVVDGAAPAATASRAWSLLPSGAGAQIRFGSREPALLSRLTWRDRVLLPGLQARLGHGEALALWPMARAALAAGDDLHAQTTHATAELVRHLADGPGLPPSIDTLLRQSPLFFLTLWMAACHLMLQTAIGRTEPGADASGLVLAMAGNGQDFGLRVRGAPQRWFTAPARAPQGPRLGDAAVPLSPMVGDSGVIEAAGFGARALALAPAIATPRFDLDAHAIAETRTPPAIAIAMLAADGRTGLAGRGVFNAPLAAFAAASAATRPRQHPTF